MLTECHGGGRISRISALWNVLPLTQIRAPNFLVRGKHLSDNPYHASLQAWISDVSKETGAPTKQVRKFVYVCLLGEDHGIPLSSLLENWGAPEFRRRLKAGINRIKNHVVELEDANETLDSYLAKVKTLAITSADLK